MKITIEDQEKAQLSSLPATSNILATFAISSSIQISPISQRFFPSTANFSQTSPPTTQQQFSKLIARVSNMMLLLQIVQHNDTSTTLVQVP